MKKSEGPLLQKSFSFAVRIIRLNKVLNEKYREYILGRQLLRCGTSIGANVREAQNAESKSDFIHKIGIAQKEAGEVIYWLELLSATGYLNKIEFNSLIIDAQEISKIISSILLTSKQRLKKVRESENKNSLTKP
ncbi:MAG: four helix bundle protein [Chitinophagaceae bacterium]|nr:MAG: four helix bundle protein [Chitinophagaceae bacterium]